MNVVIWARVSSREQRVEFETAEDVARRFAEVTSTDYVPALLEKGRQRARAEGLEVSLVNSNPATIMTDPEYADHTYVEPITPAFVAQ